MILELTQISIQKNIYNLEIFTQTCYKMLLKYYILNK